MIIMEKCVFCEIIAGRADGDIVYEDELVMAFLDIRPIHLGHTLVVPKTHYETLLDIPDEELAHLIQVTKKLSNKVMQVMEAEGFRVACNNFAPAGQVIPHLHFHIIPALPGISFRLKFQRTDTTADELREIAKKLRE